MADTKKQQIDIAERLQLALLKYFEKKLEDDPPTLSDTGAATLARLLMQNGWSIDPAKLPTGLKDKLLSGVDPTQLSDDDVDVIGKIA